MSLVGEVKILFWSQMRLCDVEPIYGKECDVVRQGNEGRW